MRSLNAIALDDPRIVVRGALHVERSRDHLRFHRLPAWTRAQSPEPAFDLMASMTSGVRLAFETTSSVLEVEALETGLQFSGEPRRRATLDLVCGATTTSADLAGGHTIVVDGPKVTFVPGAAGTVRFDLPAGRNLVELWLPQSAVTEVRKLSIESGAEIGAPPRARTWAHYGSSISHGMEAAGPSQTWPALVARGLGLDLTNLGFAGQCHLDGFVARALRDGGFDRISIKIGANIVASDTMRRRTFASSLDAFLDTIREANPATPILVMSPIHSPLLEEAPGPISRKPGGGYERQERPFGAADGALTLKDARALIETVIARRAGAGDLHLRQVNGLTLFGEADSALMPDQLHPDADGHRRLAERASGIVGEMLDRS